MIVGHNLIVLPALRRGERKCCSRHIPTYRSWGLARVASAGVASGPLAEKGRRSRALLGGSSCPAAPCLPSKDEIWSADRAFGQEGRVLLHDNWPCPNGHGDDPTAPARHDQP